MYCQITKKSRGGLYVLKTYFLDHFEGTWLHVLYSLATSL